MKNPLIAIIGGKGKMGWEFTQLFRKKKIKVLVVDIDTAITLEEAVRKAAITIVSVPISKTVKIIEHILKYAPPHALITDLTSIKVPVDAAFKRGQRRDLEMVGLHPLFGPSMVSDMRGQVIAYCPYKAGLYAHWLTYFLQHNGAVIKKTTPHEHDESMAIIQGITHFSAIASAMALKKLAVDITKTRQFASPIYSLRLAMIGRILSQSPELYADIELENPLTKKAVRAYRDSIDILSRAIKGKNKQLFIDSFKNAATYLGTYTITAQKQTDTIIKKMRDEGIW